MEDARKELADRTTVVVDRKSQIISITVTDRSPQRSAAMAQAYADELNRLLAELNTSSAHRERIFLEERLRAVTGWGSTRDLLPHRAATRIVAIAQVVAPRVQR